MSMIPIAQTPAGTEPSAARPYHHGDLRRALLDAADVLLEQLGPDGLSLRAVARQAGVSPAAPYHHFKDKEQLIAAVAREGFVRLKAAIASAARDAPPGKGKPAVLGLAYINFAQDHPALYRVMYDCARRVDSFPEPGAAGKAGVAAGVVDWEQGEDGGFGLIKQALEEARGPEATDTDVHLAAIATWCSVHGLAEMRGFTQFRVLKAEMGGEQAFLRGVLEHIGVADSLNRHRR